MIFSSPWSAEGGNFVLQHLVRRLLEIDFLGDGLNSLKILKKSTKKKMKPTKDSQKPIFFQPKTQQTCQKPPKSNYIYVAFLS